MNLEYRINLPECHRDILLTALETVTDAGDLRSRIENMEFPHGRAREVFFTEQDRLDLVSALSPMDYDSLPPGLVQLYCDGSSDEADVLYHLLNDLRQEELRMMQVHGFKNGETLHGFSL